MHSKIHSYRLRTMKHLIDAILIYKGIASLQYHKKIKKRLTKIRKNHLCIQITKKRTAEPHKVEHLKHFEGFLHVSDAGVKKPFIIRFETVSEINQLILHVILQMFQQKNKRYWFVKFTHLNYGIFYFSFQKIVKQQHSQVVLM